MHLALPLPSNESSLFTLAENIVDVQSHPTPDRSSNRGTGTKILIRLRSILCNRYGVSRLKLRMAVVCLQFHRRTLSTMLSLPDLYHPPHWASRSFFKLLFSELDESNPDLITPVLLFFEIPRKFVCPLTERPIR
jgi:hypothetical protein